MCRLFGMSGGQARVTATFWLLDAPDSLTRQSHRDPDGTGLGTYDADDRPVVDKQPISAFSDREFARAARTTQSRTFVAHIRFATTGAHTAVNTHPFEQRGRLFAHNGVVHDLPRLEAELGDDRALVRGDTDSERVFALITSRTAASGGDLRAGVVSAVTWIAEYLPVYALNLVLTTPRELFALRYPDVHELHVLPRAPGGHRGGQPLHHESSHGTRVHSEHAAQHPVVVVASETMDDDPGWRALASGELLHVDPAGSVSIERVIAGPPARPLTLADLDEHARAAQVPQTGPAS